MVQWFLPSRSSDFVLYLKAHLTYEHHISSDTMIHRNMNVVSITYMSWFSDFCPSWSSDFVLYLKAHLTYEHHKPIWHINIISSDYEMLWHSVWPQYECRSLWPIFHGPVILLYIWKTIWHMNIILPDYEMVWPDNSPQYECTSLFIYCN